MIGEGNSRELYRLDWRLPTEIGTKVEVEILNQSGTKMKNGGEMKDIGFSLSIN